MSVPYVVLRNIADELKKFERFWKSNQLRNNPAKLVSTTTMRGIAKNVMAAQRRAIIGKG